MANIYVSSGTSFSATISITYPAGSTCTVSNYKKTWTAPNTSGSWTFEANEIGHYTVKATSESKSVEEEVFITTDGQVATVTLIYTLVLFDGADNTAVTGGFKFQVGNGSSATVKAAPIVNRKITWSESSYVGLYTSSKVDITDYSTLVINIEISDNPAFYYIKRAGIITPSLTPLQVMDFGGGAGSRFTAYQELTGGTTQLRVDVSSLSGQQQFMLMYYSDNDISFVIRDIHFE